MLTCQDFYPRMLYYLKEFYMTYSLIPNLMMIKTQLSKIASINK